jgi:accessory colonization factor AcfC
MIIDLPDGAESTSHTSRIVNVGVGSTEAWRDAARLNARALTAESRAGSS